MALKKHCLIELAYSYVDHAMTTSAVVATATRGLLASERDDRRVAVSALPVTVIALPVTAV